MDDNKMLLSVYETAEVLGVSVPTLYNLIHRDDFPSFKVGRRTLISKQGLEAWVQAQLEQGVRI